MFNITIDPTTMTPEARLAELVDIFARGVLRCQVAQAARAQGEEPAYALPDYEEMRRRRAKCRKKKKHAS